jgi:hypothetical protein
MSIVVLLVLVAAVVTVPLLLIARRRKGTPGTSSPAEFLVYLILVGATLVATHATSSLIELVLPQGQVVIGAPEELALPLAMLLVAGIVAVSLWLTLERQTFSGGRPARDLYISAVTGFSLAVVAFSGLRLGLWAVGQISFPPEAAADLVAFGAVWTIHERVRVRGAGLDRLRSVVGSAVGLGISVAGISRVLHASLSAAFESGSVVAGEGQVWRGIAAGLVLLVVGGPYFWWFWLRDVIKQADIWRNGYATVVAIVSWFTAVGAGSALVYSILSGLFGLDDYSRIDSALPVQITATVVAGLAYWHHREVLGRERNNQVRLAHYAFSAAGFITAAFSLVSLAATAVENWTGPAIAGSNAEVVLGSSIALLVATAILGIYWRLGQSLSADPAERKAISRRVAIVGLLTGFSLAAAGALIAVLFVLLRSALGGAGSLAESLAWAVPLTVVGGLFAWYFNRVRPRREGGVERAAPGAVGIVTVVASDPGPLPQMIDGLRFLRRTDGVGTVDQEQALAVTTALSRLESRAALVVVGAEGFEVLPLA